jgi:hypothetical protein
MPDSDHERILSEISKRMSMARVSTEILAGRFTSHIHVICYFPESKVSDFIVVQTARSNAILGPRDRPDIEIAIDMGSLGLQEIMAGSSAPARRVAVLHVPEPGIRTSYGWHVTFVPGGDRE